MRLHTVIIEDDPDIAFMLEIALEVGGLDVEGNFDTVTEAMSWPGWSDIDAAVVDLMIPGSTGIDMLHWLKQTYPDVLRVVSTAMAEKDARERVGDCADAIFIKPYDPREIIDYVRQRRRTRS